MVQGWKGIDLSVVVGLLILPTLGRGKEVCMSSRVLYEDQYSRVVELSSVYDGWSPLRVVQTVAILNGSYKQVKLGRPTGEGVDEFDLTFDEVAVLLSAYQSYLTDRETQKREVAARIDDLWNDPLEEHPF